MTKDEKPVAFMYYEAVTGGGYSSIPRFYTNPNVVIPNCHKGPISLYTQPTTTCDCGRPLSPGLCHICDNDE